MSVSSFNRGVSPAPALEDVHNDLEYERYSYIGPVRRTRGPVRRREAALVASLACADLAAAAAALAVANIVSGTVSIRAAELVLLPAVLLIGKVAGLYDHDKDRVAWRTLEDAPSIFGTATTSTLVAAVVAHRLDTGSVLAVWGVLFAAMLTGRMIARGAILSRVAPERCLVVGDVSVVDRVRERIANDPVAHARVVGHMARTDDGENSPGPFSLQDVRELNELVTEMAVDRVIVVPRTTQETETLDLIRSVKALGVKVSVLTRLFEVVGPNVKFDQVDGMTLLGVHSFGLSRPAAALKRAFDVVGALLGLIAIAPVMAAIALAIRLDSPGPILFRQPRVGRDGSCFWLIKFRTMVADAEEQKPAMRDRNEARGLFKIAQDPRVTGLGRILRRSSLDELPQLVNVLRGEMSLVGPRPLVVDEDERVEGWDRRRLHLTPGMTGPWQILGASRCPLDEMVKVDYLYAANWSLWDDVKILLRTVAHVLGRRGV